MSTASQLLLNPLLKLGPWIAQMDVEQRGAHRYCASLVLTHTSELVSAGGYCDTWQGPRGTLLAAIRNAWWHGRGMAAGFGCDVSKLPLHCPFEIKKMEAAQLALF